MNPNFACALDFMLGKTFLSNFLPKIIFYPFLDLCRYSFFAIFAPLDGANHPEACTRNDLLDKIIYKLYNTLLKKMKTDANTGLILHLNIQVPVLC